MIKAVKELLAKEFVFRQKEFLYTIPDYRKTYKNFVVYLLCSNGMDWSRNYIKINIAGPKPLGINKFYKMFKKHWRHYTLKQFKEMMNYLEKWDKECTVMKRLKDLNNDFV